MKAIHIDAEHIGSDAELMFVEVLRRYLETLPPGQQGWLAGLRDDVVGRRVNRVP